MNRSLVVLLALGCADKANPADSGGDCDTMAVASVQVTVSLAEPDRAEAVTVTATDAVGDPVLCEAMPDDETWVCGWEQSGVIHLRAQADWHQATEYTVDVQEGVCHVQTELVDLVLPRDPDGLFPASRLYAVQLIEDPDECENSWELYGMNCYMTADFCADGSATVIVTDIINSGTYGVAGDAVTAWLGDGDAPDPMTWQTIDETTLRDDAWGLDWELDVDGDLYPMCP